MHVRNTINDVFTDNMANVNIIDKRTTAPEDALNNLLVLHFMHNISTQKRIYVT